VSTRLSSQARVSPLLTMQPTLPPELVQHILDYLCNSVPDFCTCALVCKTWSMYCRRHIFYRIDIHPRSYSLYRYRRLYDLIQQSPHIALCVHELRISDRCDRPPLLEDIIYPLLPSFTRLRKLELGNRRRRIFPSR
jgi:F-box-like